MASASAKVIIDAEDLASKKIAEAARNVEQSVKNIKDVGGKAKASTEFIGTLATSLGGSELGSYAGQLGQLTERISAFSEVSKAGGAGAMAFKAGLVGVVGVLSFQVGKALGDAVFGTSRWKLEIEAATEAAKKLSSEVERSAGNRFGSEMKSIDMLGDPEAQKQATTDLLAQLDKDIEGKAKALESYRKKVMEVEMQWMPLTTLGKTIHEQNKLQVAEAERLKDIFKEQAQELREKLVADEQSLKLREKELAAATAKANLDRSNSYLESLKKELDMLKAAEQGKAAMFGEQAARNTHGDAAKFQAEQMLSQIDAMKAAATEQKVIDDAKERAAQKAIDDAKRIEDIKQREIDRLKEQRIELEKGAEAAKAFALEQQGLDKATAAQLAKEQTRLDEAKQQADKSGPQIAQSIQVVESRLLTRGPSSDPIGKVVDNGRVANKELAAIRGELKTLNAKPQNKNLEFQLVGA